MTATTPSPAIHLIDVRIVEIVLAPKSTGHARARPI